MFDCGSPAHQSGSVSVCQVPFRAAHGVAGECVALAEKKGCSLSDLTVQDMKSVQ